MLVAGSSVCGFRLETFFERYLKIVCSDLLLKGSLSGFCVVVCVNFERLPNCEFVAESLHI